jgi:hypothetical protein
MIREISKRRFGSRLKTLKPTIGKALIFSRRCPKRSFTLIILEYYSMALLSLQINYLKSKIRIDIKGTFLI